MAEHVWVAVHYPVNIGGQVILHRQESASVIPDALVAQMDTAARNGCIKMHVDRAKIHFPDLFKPDGNRQVLPPPEAQPAPAAEAK